MAIITNTTITTDIDPAISIDFASRLADNINALRDMLDIADMTPLRDGGSIPIYHMVKVNTPAQVSEGDEIPLTKIQRRLAKTLTITLNKYRKLVTAEAIIRDGRENAINKTDRELMSEARSDIKAAFVTAVTSGTGTSAGGTNLQQALAKGWAAVDAGFEGKDFAPVHFINSLDLADYLGNAQVTMQDTFGLKYLRDFIGLGDTFVSASFPQGKVWSTAKENLRGYYVPVDSELAETFSLTVDESGIVGICHGLALDRASINSLVMAGTVFAPEYSDKVYQGTITPATPSQS